MRGFYGAFARGFYGAFALLTVLVSGAHAQSPAEMDALKRYVGSKPYVQMLVDAALVGENQAAPECHDRRPLDRADFVLFVPAKFSNSAHPVAGMWRDRLKVERCGNLVFQNVFFMAQPNGPPQTALLLPGLTTASPQLQQDALAMAAPVATGKAGCRGEDVAVADTRPEGILVPTTRTDAKGMALDGKWRELWSFRACGKPVSVHVDFSADGKGGTFFAVAP